MPFEYARVVVNHEDASVNVTVPGTGPQHMPAADVVGVFNTLGRNNWELTTQAVEVLPSFDRGDVVYTMYWFRREVHDLRS